MKKCITVQCASTFFFHCKLAFFKVIKHLEKILWTWMGKIWEKIKRTLTLLWIDNFKLSRDFHCAEVHTALKAKTLSKNYFVSPNSNISKLISPNSPNYSTFQSSPNPWSKQWKYSKAPYSIPKFSSPNSMYEWNLLKMTFWTES